jgi:hypothetical protein
MAYSLFEKEHFGEFILVILLVLYLVLGLKTPQPLANLIDNIFAKIIICLIVLYLFMHAHPLLATLALFVAFNLIINSNMNNYAMQNFLPSEANKMGQFTAFNQFPYTLEQEVVNKMAPIVISGTTLTQASYHPNIENIHDATKI